MPDVTSVIKTWPAVMPRKHVLKAFNAFSDYYFTVGRGKPKRAIDKIYFTHHGRILGYFNIREIVQNVGQLPRLNRIDGTPSDWQIKDDAWVAICTPPFVELEETIYFAAFRGFRYFDLDSYRGTMGAKLRI